jgi:hypothetical protein
MHYKTKPPVVIGECPRYTEEDILAAQQDMDFVSLRRELERIQGKSLTIDELKMLLGMTHYLGMPAEVIFMLVCYCRDRARQKEQLRLASLHNIEKEAYAWAAQGISTVEDAAAFIQKQNIRDTKLEKLKGILQVQGRRLTQAEDKYASAWVEMGFAEDALALAYERTCLNTGSLRWAYMDKILQRWHEAGCHSAQQVLQKDKRMPPKGASGQFGQAELDAIARVLKESQYATER